MMTLEDDDAGHDRKFPEGELPHDPPEFTRSYCAVASLLTLIYGMIASPGSIRGRIIAQYL
eukprot:scaffold6351_cov166-Amphora_coffeaeformis.AAC.5